MGVEPELFVSDAVESVESRAVTAVSVGDSEAVTHSLSCDHVPDKITDLTASPLPAISDEASAAAMGATTAALASAAAFGFGGPAGLAASESVNDSAVKLINSVNSENVGSDLVADVVSSLEVPTVPASTVVNEEKKLDLADECVDGLYASRTGVWRPYQLLSATGLVTPAEEAAARTRVALQPQTCTSKPPRRVSTGRTLRPQMRPRCRTRRRQWSATRRCTTPEGRAPAR